MERLIAGTKRTKRFEAYQVEPIYTYSGVLKDERGKVIWQCEHVHRNRDNDSYAYIRYRELSGQSACTCATQELMRRNTASE